MLKVLSALNWAFQRRSASIDIWQALRHLGWLPPWYLIVNQRLSMLSGPCVPFPHAPSPFLQKHYFPAEKSEAKRPLGKWPLRPELGLHRGGQGLTVQGSSSHWQLRNASLRPGKSTWVRRPAQLLISLVTQAGHMHGSLTPAARALIINDSTFLGGDVRVPRNQGHCSAWNRLLMGNRNRLGQVALSTMAPQVPCCLQGLGC